MLERMVLYAGCLQEMAKDVKPLEAAIGRLSTAAGGGQPEREPDPPV